MFLRECAHVRFRMNRRCLEKSMQLDFWQVYKNKNQILFLCITCSSECSCENVHRYSLVCAFVARNSVKYSLIFGRNPRMNLRCSEKCKSNTWKVINNLCLMQSSCKNWRLCSLVWVARIHTIYVMKWVNTSINPFNLNGTSHSFQLDQSITVFG